MEYKRPTDIPRQDAGGRVRLERLAAFLDQVPRSHLSFASWRTCAVGLAAKEPWFQAQGLGLDHDERVNECRPSYAGRTDWIAVAQFFEIGVGEVRQLLDPMGYDGDLRPHPQRVADKIRRYLAMTEVAA